MGEDKNIEKDIKIYEEAVSIDRSKQKSRKIFVFYIIGLFCVALGLILLSYVMQAHANKQLADLGAQLTQQTDAAAGAKSRADQLQQTLDALQSQLEQSKQQNDELSEKADMQEKAIDALMELIRLERAWEAEDIEGAKKIVEELDKAYTRAVLTDSSKEPLSGEAAEEYAKLCENLGV